MKIRLMNILNVFEVFILLVNPYHTNYLPLFKLTKMN